MPIDPNIALGVRPPQQQNPLEGLSHILTLRHLMGQVPLQQEQLRSAQLENQQRERTATEYQGVRDAIAGANGDIEKAIPAVMRISPKTGLELSTSVRAQQKAGLELQKMKIEHDLKASEFIGQSLAGATDDATYQSAVQGLKAAGLPVDQMPPQFDPAAVQRLRQKGMTIQQQLEEGHKAVSEKLAKEAGSREEEIQPSKVIKAQQDAISATQKTTGQEPITPYQQAEIDARKAAATETGRHNKVEEGLSAGTLAVRRAGEMRNEKIFDQTYGAGANEALVGVEPKSRQPALREAQKAADEYNKANTAAEDMQTFLDLARKGNKAAGSNLPLVGVSTINALNGIKRINQAEIQQYEGAGSLLDRIQGRIGKLAIGQPIPADVLNDIESLHKTLSGNAAKAYNRKLDSINQNFKSSFKPVGETKQAPTATEAVVEWTRDASGKPVPKTK